MFEWLGKWFINLYHVSTANLKNFVFKNNCYFYTNYKSVAPPYEKESFNLGYFDMPYIPEHTCSNQSSHRTSDGME